MTSQTLLVEDVSRLLQDAGCTKEFAQRFLSTMETGSVQALLQLLQTQRRCQLDQLHREEKKLDLLDYLRYRLKKQLPLPDKKKSRRHMGKRV